MAEPIRNSKQPVAPTPQNTPSSVSTLEMQTPMSRARTGMASISEGDVGGEAQLLNVLQSRLGGLNGLKSNYIEMLPKQVKDRLAALKGLRVKQSKIEGDFHYEVFELEKKYLKRQQDLFDMRRKLIAGEAEPKPEDILEGEAAFEEERATFDGEEEDEEDDEIEAIEGNKKPESTKKPEDKKKVEETVSEEHIKGIPGFWFTCFSNVPHLNEMIHERDNDVLNYLVDVRLRLPEKPGFILEFEFEENPYFTNKVLTKTYVYQENIGLSGDFIFESAKGTDIKWTSTENNVTVRVEKRKQRNKHTKATRTIEKTLPEESFFNFFNPPSIEDLANSNNDEEDEYSDTLHAALVLDFELGEFFKEKLIPKAIDWFTGRAIDYEGLSEVDDVPEDDDFDEDLDDEDDEEDDNNEKDTLEDMKKEVPENCKQQ